MTDTLRIGFVTGATPDKWARHWRDRRRERLELVPVTEADQLDGVRDGSLDMALVRLPVDRDGLHCVRLYDELQVAVASRDHVLAAADEEVTTGDLDDEQLVRPHPSGWTPTADQLDWPPMSEQEAIETVAAGTGVVVVPMSVARLHQRKDVVTRVVTDLEPTTIALVWLVDRDDDVTQAFVGVTKGRTAEHLALSLRSPRRGTGRACASSSREPAATSAPPLSDGWPTTAGTSSSGSSGAHRRARCRSPRWSGWPLTSPTTRTRERCTPPARAPTPSCTSRGASSPRTGRPTCARSASAAPGASSTPWWPRACRTSCTCRRWAPTPPSVTTPRSTRRGRPSGVPTSMYSRHKAAAERLLDEMEVDAPDVTVTRVRPGIIGQRSAGSALLRYGLPALVPAGLLRHVPVLPIDSGLVIPMVHADDVADALSRVLDARAPGAFNLAAEPPVTAQDVADALGARLVHVPSAAVRAAVSASWHARVQPLDPGWIDMGYAVPLLDTTRARTELGWAPSTDATSVLAETLAGMQDTASSGTPGPPTSHRRRWPGPRAASWSGQLSPGAVSSTRVAAGTNPAAARRASSCSSPVAARTVTWRAWRRASTAAAPNAASTYAASPPGA